MCIIIGIPFQRYIKVYGQMSLLYIIYNYFILLSSILIQIYFISTFMLISCRKNEYIYI